MPDGTHPANAGGWSAENLPRDESKSGVTRLPADRVSAGNLAVETAHSKSIEHGAEIMKTFLAVGDLLINPNLLAFAAVEGDAEDLKLRLAFSTPGAQLRNEVRLVGEEARATLRWLRLNATFVNQEAAFGSTGSNARTGRLVPSYGDDPVREREVCASVGTAR
ncbi:MAG: hypothetical protein JWN86_937 [Planctomycetota bacterium]|nr:hypothetical protein [Planctomycetota bacterium]